MVSWYLLVCLGIGSVGVMILMLGSGDWVDGVVCRIAGFMNFNWWMSFCLMSCVARCWLCCQMLFYGLRLMRVIVSGWLDMSGYFVLF